MTKLLSGFVLPSHTSSMQPAVHISHTRTWAFCLKWLADLKTQREQERSEHRCKRPPPHIPILTSDAGINLIHRWRAGGAAKMFLNSSVRGLKYSNTHTHLCLLGFGDHQRVSEQEEVSVLGLHPGPQLNVAVEKKRPVRAAEEGLDQWAALWTHRNQEALSRTQTHGD